MIAMTGAAEFVKQADALIGSDLSKASIDVQSMAATYKRRKDDRRAHVYARALVNRARSEGVQVGSGSGGSVTKKDLLAEIDRRNQDRDEDKLIVVDSKATKADLEAALKADDES